MTSNLVICNLVNQQHIEQHDHSLFFDNLKYLCLNQFILNYFSTSAWGKCANSIFFHTKISLTESVTKVSVKC